jgi:hypothetical protein
VGQNFDALRIDINKRSKIAARKGEPRMAEANPKGWTAVLCRLAPFEAHGEHKCSERLHWSQRDARREAEGWARDLGQKPIRWEVLDDNMALGRVDDHVVLLRSIILPSATHRT